MADWLPNCTKQDFGTSGGSWTRQPAVICIHSTEGTSWPSYDGGQTAPHFTINLLTKQRRQHISMGVAARALANKSGGPETNRAGVIQIEVIGTCDPSRKGKPGWFYIPEMTDAHAAYLAELMRDIADNKSISWVCNVTFRAYPSSYGAGNGVRLSGSSWNTYKGILGHQHVPENDHGDPGNINIKKIMSYGDDDDMPLTEDDLNKIAAKVWAFMTTTANDGSKQSMGTLLRWAQADAKSAATNTAPDSTK